MFIGDLFILAWLLAQNGLPAPSVADLPVEAQRQIAALQAEKAARTPEERKVSSVLLLADRLRQGLPAADGVALPAPQLDVDDAARVLVDIDAEVTPALREAIAAAGGTIVVDLPVYRSIRARLPLAALRAVAGLPEVRNIRPADQAMVQQATSKVNTSQGDVAHRADAARALNFTGSRVPVGVLSDGVSTLSSRQASGDLPSNVTVISGQAGTSGDEGTAMLEIVHDLAPGSPLFFATAFSGQAQFAANITSLCSAGAKVIVDDVYYFAEPVFEDGVIAQAVNSAIDNGCDYFSSAGNSGNANDGTSGVWEGDFSPAGTLEGLGEVHSFGSATSNVLTRDTPFLITLQWSDKWGASANDYDLFLFTADGTTLIAASNDEQGGSGDPFEAINSSGSATNHANARLVIVRYSGASRFLHLNTHRGRLQFATAGQTSGHATAELAYGIAAVNVATASGGAFTGGSANPVETFSSDGPRRVFYNRSGAAITPGNFLSSGGTVRNKPDFAAADGVATSTPGFGSFFGTSAAAPHAAAIAALVLDAAGGADALSAAALRNVLSGSALDIEASGIDRDSGRGIIDAFRAVSAVVRTFDDDPLVVGLHQVRARHITQLRSRIDTLRAKLGLSATAWTDSTITAGVTMVKLVHLTEMRAALSQVYVALGRSAPGFTAAGAGSTIAASHVTELRNAVVAVE